MGAPATTTPPAPVGLAATSTVEAEPAAGPAPVDWGWVQAEPNQLRPAYRRPNGVIVYSPNPLSRWQEAPPQIAATWLLQHLASEPWRAFMAPAGMQIVDYPRRPLTGSQTGSTNNLT